MIASMTVAELTKELKKLPQSWPVFVSTDPEGNSYSSFKADYLMGGSKEDKIIVLYPIDTHMDDEIMPIATEKMMAQIESDIKNANGGVS